MGPALAGPLLSLDNKVNGLHPVPMSSYLTDPLALTEEERRALYLLEERLGPQQRFGMLKAAIGRQDTKAIGSLLDEGMALHGAAYPLLLITGSLEDVYALYRRLGIDDEIRDATLCDIRRWIDEHAHRSNGEIGLSQVYWIARHLSARIVQLGSLQYEPKLFGYPYRIYRGDRHQHLLVIAEAGLGCDREGYRTEEDHSAYITALEEDDTTLRAHVVDTTTGRIKSSMETFDRRGLTLFCDSETDVLNIHIPKGAPLGPDDVDTSFGRAQRMFPACPLMVCTSWLLDPALKTVASEQSNIVRFMERFAKVGVTFSSPQLYERVFGHGYGIEEVLAHPADTSLQSRVQAALREGVVFRTMGGYVAPYAGV